jgi:hypothetical protein
MLVSEETREKQRLAAKASWSERKTNGFPGLSEDVRCSLEQVIGALRLSPSPLTFEQLAAQTSIPPHHLKLVLEVAKERRLVRERVGAEIVFEY